MRRLALVTATTVFGSVSSALSQNSTAVGAAVEVTKSYNLSRAWKVQLGFGTELRPVLYSDAELAAETPPTLRNLDLNLGVERRWLERWVLGTGLRGRTRYPWSAEAATELRPWLYATRKADVRYFRTSQRFRSELRLRGDEGEPLTPSYRHRYRIAAERPLVGLVQDKGEWSITASVEVLLSSSALLSSATALDVRPYLAVARKDLQLGIELRNERSLREDDDSVESAVLVVLQWGL